MCSGDCDRRRAPFRVVGNLSPECGAQGTKQTIADAAQRARMAVATLAQGIVASSGSGIMLDGDARPVMNSGLQPPVAGEAAGHEALLAALPRHRRNPCQSAQGVIVSCLQQLRCLGEQCGEYNPADSRPGAKDAEPSTAAP